MGEKTLNKKQSTNSRCWRTKEYLQLGSFQVIQTNKYTSIRYSITNLSIGDLYLDLLYAAMRC